ncbi:carboxymethylenebutenolidase [Cypionkella aquatica]|uniref:Carboxymethylenebutenolidase n=1 Tax=Cypionkella aquatica TaxID=1756042 RepID=A0AA37U1N0_9RHOB|nr:dienelactone hydrolase family protein [Cypionkella aquatica]GLS85929.1 carboxymethylenebutenolidase [Cypionkella aquatica]
MGGYNMGETVRLTASDGFSCDAYVARPAGAPKGGIVVVQEIFGVNAHIRSVADRYAALGYLAIAPALFDRAEPGFQSGYQPEDMPRAYEMMGKVSSGPALLDIAAAIGFAAEAGKVGVVGYCWGGTLAWSAAANLPGLSAAVGYYGGGVLGLTDLQPACPVMLHFGALDGHIPVDKVQEFAASRPEIPVFIYDGADHGFNCDARGSYNAAAAQLAQERTSAHFAKYLL